MQTGSKLRCYNPLPLGITLSSVFQYRGIHIQNFKILQTYPMFIYLLLNFQDQAPRLPRASLAGSQLSAHPQVKELCGYYPLYVPSLDNTDINDVLHIPSVSLPASSLPAQFPLSLHAWTVSYRVARMNVPLLTHLPFLCRLLLEGFLPPFANQ